MEARHCRICYVGSDNDLHALAYSVTEGRFSLYHRHREKVVSYAENVKPAAALPWALLYIDSMIRWCEFNGTDYSHNTGIGFMRSLRADIERQSATLNRGSDD